jgi:hypothetical protein
VPAQSVKALTKAFRVLLPVKIFQSLESKAFFKNHKFHILLRNRVRVPTTKNAVFLFF